MTHEWQPDPYASPVSLSHGAIRSASPVAFALAASASFLLSSCRFKEFGPELRRLLDNPLQAVAALLPVFVFAAVIGTLNLFWSAPASNYFRSLIGRISGGTVLGASAIPVNHFVIDHVLVSSWILPSRLLEVAFVISVPVVLCTIAERRFLRYTAISRKNLQNEGD